MRKPVALSTMFAAATLTVGLFAGVAGADSPSAAPPSIPSPEDILASLTPEQQSCLIENIGGVDTSDMTAMMAVIEQCGISMTDLLEPGASTGTALPSDPLTSGAPALDPFANIGIDAVTQQCIADAVLATPPADDTAAIAVLTGCGASLTSIVTMIGGGGVATSTPVGSAVPSATTGDPFVDMMRTQLEASGISLSDEQLKCLTDAVLADPDAFANADTDPSVILPLLESCNINLSDLV